MAKEHGAARWQRAERHRRRRSNALQIDPAANTSRPVPAGHGRGKQPRPAASEREIVSLIAEARANLGAEDLEAVRIVLAREADLLCRGALPARPRGRLREGRPPLSPAARAFLRPIRIALAEVARLPGVAPADLVALGERIRGYLAAPGPPGLAAP